MGPNTPRNAVMLSILAAVVAAVASGDAPCTCSCCGVQPASADARATCAALGSESCSKECAPESGTASDYTLFCFDSCAPSSSAASAQCSLISSLDHALPEEVRAVEPSAAAEEAPRPDGVRAEEQADANLIAEAKIHSAKIRRAPVERGLGSAPKKSLLAHKKATEPSPTQLQLAKAAMLEAKVHAKAAGSAARRAKESYELALRSSREMAEYAGKLVYGEIQREAGEQSKKALQIRNDYVKASQEAGIANAVAAAAPYKKAQGVAGATAAMWNIRANEFAASAGALKGQAQQMAKDAQKYTDTQDFADAEMYSNQAHQLVAQSNEMADNADNAHKTANDIQSNSNWYLLAARGAAASALGGSMPYDVPPPPLPPSVFL